MIKDFFVPNNLFSKILNICVEIECQHFKVGVNLSFANKICIGLPM